MSRINTKLGDVFYVKFPDGKRYFQYIANDQTQLNSDVIRIFRTKYSIQSSPELSEIVNDDIELYVHCNTKLGVKMKLWEKMGYTSEIGNTKTIVFRIAADYARREGENAINISHKWYVWNINDTEFTLIGKLEGEYKKAFIGIVMNPNGIMELLKGNKYPANYPD